ncbi:MAG: trypsin-like peptidase domain-containing protein [Gemmataceae bacterium]|nr:trypsin-like peptidase domain-containing protein [Gemmataceae bacterium]
MRLHLCFLGLVSFVTFSIVGHLPAQEGPARANLLNSVEPRGDAGLVRTGARKTHVVAAIQRVRAAVVNIHSERHLAAGDHYTLAPSTNRVNGMGTGIIIDPRGYIVTNQHVVEDVSLLRIRLADGATQNAAVVARAPDMDLALLKIDPAQPLAVMPIGTAQDLMVGETVIAIGNAYGYEHTVSLGIVSALKRDVSLNKDMSYKALIQTDASINPGNSGGPLINVHGEMVGVNVAIRAGAQGIGFAIPADNMVRTVTEMLRSRRRSQNYDGLVFRDKLDAVTDGLARSVIVDRANGPADQAGLQPGDQLLQIGDVRIGCGYDVERAFLDRRPGDILGVLIRRGDKEERLELTLAGADRQIIRPAAHSDLVWNKLGLQLSPAPADQVKNFNKQLHGGMEVLHVQTDGPAARAGIKKGDILVGLHQWETVNMDNVSYVLNHADWNSFQPLSFFILRNGQVRRGTIGGN